MAKERRDSKNRILRKGEYQKSDGRYMYRYTDAAGDTQYVYSWTLTSTDRTPKGKPSEKCLRDKEKDIEQDLISGISVKLSKTKTVNDYFELYMSQKRKLKPTTRALYRSKYDLHVRSVFGERKIADIKYSDVISLYNSVVDDDGKGVGVMLIINTILNPVFRLAIRDNCIRANPIIGAAKEVKSDVGKTKTKKFALSDEEQKTLLSYIKGHNVFYKWHPLIVFLLGTGCRIGEACGLTWDDCDFENDLISVNKNLRYTPEESTQKYIWTITTPKSESGIREIPMLSDVKNMLLEEYNRQRIAGFCESTISGVSGFVFMCRDKTALMPRAVNAAIKRIVDSYNENEIERAEHEDQSPNCLPNITPHILRHTFCTKLCSLGVNIKVVQEVMGHANINITMDIYNNISMDYKKKEMFAIEKKYRIS